MAAPSVSASFEATGTASSAASSMTLKVNRAWHRLGQLFCVHDYLRAFEDDRVLMRCTKCKHETPGWSVARANRR